MIKYVFNLLEKKTKICKTKPLTPPGLTLLKSNNKPMHAFIRAIASILRIPFPEEEKDHESTD
jgi:hypothetical protein